MKEALVLSILSGGLIAFALTAITQPEYIRDIKHTTETTVKLIWGTR